MTNATVPPLPVKPEPHSTELSQMTRVQLCALAQELGVEDAKPTMRKADLIALVEGAGL